MKIPSVGANFFHADRRMDGRTDMTKLIVAFRNFANAPERGCFESPKFRGGCPSQQEMCNKSQNL